LTPAAAAAARARRTGRTTVPHELRVRPEHATRAASVVSRRDLEERLPRSAPDALRWEPGVYVQQTAHGQASPFVRGLTGQQTIMMFDGIRLNNSTFRQGPNQYFFTIDSRTVQKLEVVRGSSSIRHGSDAMGGALLATPIDPSLQLGARRLQVRPRGMLRTGTADGEIGGRAQLDLSYKGKLGVFGGVGYRDVGLLRAGGHVYAPDGNAPVKVPVFLEGTTTQRGTGFKELTADARLVWQAHDKLRLTLAYYDYRQSDAPRTDRCPPATAPQSECLNYDEQYRTLVYAALDVKDGPAFAESLRFTVNYQNQHERRRYDRGPDSTYRIIGRDDVYTGGTALAARTRAWGPAGKLQFHGAYGFDLYHDTISSKAWNIYLPPVSLVRELSRGQYLDGGKYLTSGLWTEGHFKVMDRLELRAGVRGAFVTASAPGDEMSESVGVDKRWATAVGGGGAALRLADGVKWIANADQGFRAPNLDDLTSRQQTGAGYQGENPALRPEKALSLETGVRVDRPRVELQLFGFQTLIDGMIARTPLDKSMCPPGLETGCAGSSAAYILTNLEGRSRIRGLDGAVRVFLPAGVALRGTVAYAWGDGPDTVPNDEVERRPLSRIPPLNGTAEVSWRHRTGFYAAAGLRWARAQTRLALADTDDQRIPRGGTPGFAVADLRAGYRWQPHVLLAMVLENLTDAAYRYHGSAINGPGRSLIVHLEFGF
jgi:iron complex outermembrane receptor protein/hemoglobin/transferrin/lactoferrin receptor protein